MESPLFLMLRRLPERLLDRLRELLLASSSDLTLSCVEVPFRILRSVPSLPLLVVESSMVVERRARLEERSRELVRSLEDDLVRRRD